MAAKTNVPKLKGAGAQGSRPRGSKAVVPNGMYPTVIGTHGAPNTPEPHVGLPGDLTVNSTPSPKGK